MKKVACLCKERSDEAISIKNGIAAPYMGFPTVICGPGSITQAYTTCEFVDLQEIADAAQLSLDAAQRLLE